MGCGWCWFGCGCLLRDLFWRRLSCRRFRCKGRGRFGGGRGGRRCWVWGRGWLRRGLVSWCFLLVAGEEYCGGGGGGEEEREGDKQDPAAAFGVLGWRLVVGGFLGGLLGWCEGDGGRVGALRCRRRPSREILGGCGWGLLAERVEGVLVDGDGGVIVDARNRDRSRPMPQTMLNVRQRHREGAQIREPVPRLTRHRPPQSSSEIPRETLRQHRRRRLQHVRQNLLRRLRTVRLKRTPPRRQGENRRPQRILIRRRAHRARAHLDQLRRHEMRRQPHPGTLDETIPQRRDPEIPQRRIPEIRLENILRLHITVNHPSLMRRRQRARHPHTQRQQLLQRQRTITAHQLHVIPALKQIHHNARPIIRRERRRQHRHNERMPRQTPHRLTLPLKRRHRRIIRQTLIQNLQRHPTIKRHLIRPKHTTKPPTPHLNQTRKTLHHRHITHHHTPPNTNSTHKPQTANSPDTTHSGKVPTQRSASAISCQCPDLSGGLQEPSRSPDATGTQALPCPGQAQEERIA